MSQPIRFDNGATYERYMGVWSQSVGEVFLDWLAPPLGADWLDVGCGNGAFTEILATRHAPAAVTGVDPSAEQLAFARERPALRTARFHQGDAMALPLTDNSVDQAVMPLVIFFVPEPSRGVAEMARVVRPGGIVSAYGWDLMNGGFPYFAVQLAMRELGLDVPMPPSPDAASVDSLEMLWNGAGLAAVETRTIEVTRTFPDFDDYWTTVLGGPSVSASLAALTPAQAGALQSSVREKLQVAANGPITISARANAVKGRVVTMQG
ncbi:MAG TPA: class I SAM-dependent methyltransferase [Moraxellaceae bacterium]|nr:class I SAM-dependent methyltransferase [Moraxellaceae bacterium]